MNAINESKLKKNQAAPVRDKWKFSDLIADPVIRQRWEKVRKYFFLRESTYDMSNRCNIRCNGCYYFEGDKQFAKENNDPEAWRLLMRDEKARGITYVVLARRGAVAGPAPVPGLHEEMPLGSIATNGFRKIPNRSDTRYTCRSGATTDEREDQEREESAAEAGRELQRRRARRFALYIHQVEHRRGP